MWTIYECFSCFWIIFVFSSEMKNRFPNYNLFTNFNCSEIYSHCLNLLTKKSFSYNLFTHFKYSEIHSHCLTLVRDIQLWTACSQTPSVPPAGSGVWEVWGFHGCPWRHHTQLWERAPGLHEAPRDLQVIGARGWWGGQWAGNNLSLSLIISFACSVDFFPAHIWSACACDRKADLARQADFHSHCPLSHGDCHMMLRVEWTLGADRRYTIISAVICPIWGNEGLTYSKKTDMQ